MKIYTIIDLATDREYTDTLKMLLYMIDNCNNTTTKDYDIVVDTFARSIKINLEKFLQLNFNKIQCACGSEAVYLVNIVCSHNYGRELWREICEKSADSSSGWVGISNFPHGVKTTNADEGYYCGECLEVV